MGSGEYLEFDKSNFAIKKYYNIEDHINEESDYDTFKFHYYIDKIKELFMKVNEHSLFDVQGGLHISSGADSVNGTCTDIRAKI